MMQFMQSRLTDESLRQLDELKCEDLYYLADFTIQMAVRETIKPGSYSSMLSKFGLTVHAYSFQRISCFRMGLNVYESNFLRAFSLAMHATFPCTRVLTCCTSTPPSHSPLALQVKGFISTVKMNSVCQGSHLRDVFETLKTGDNCIEKGL